MAILTEAGALYLNGYYTLNEARNEMDQFLNEVIIAVHTKLIDKLRELSDHTCQWSVWNNQSSPGYMEINLRMLKAASTLLRAGKSDIFIIYRDIRNSPRIIEPQSIELHVTTLGQDKHIGLELQKASEASSDSQVLGYHYPAIDINSSEGSAETIAEMILGLCIKLRKIMGSIIGKGK